jgi:hypothetical protein
MPTLNVSKNAATTSNTRSGLTLKDAAGYIMKLPKKESDLPDWQTAIEALMLCSRGGDAMLARIGVAVSV